MRALVDKPLRYLLSLAEPKLPDADRWGLALGAMYSRINGASDARLAPHGPLLVGQSIGVLYHSWGVKGRGREARHGEAMQVLDWLAREGHRAELAEPGDREAVIDLLAWDIARGVNVARHAYHARYISAEEAWTHIRGAARAAQASFPSWAEYGQRFLRGRLRWRTERDPRFDRVVARLSKSARSPWRRLDWRLPLAPPEAKAP
jgi:hypothetical protein